LHELMVGRPQGKPWGRSFFFSGLAALALGVLLSLPTSAVRAIGADAPNEIPGLPWSGSSVTASVGGATVDRVWRIEVTSARQAILELSGATGAELGLYVFDATATSILTATPLRQSALPGAAQRLSVPLLPGTYYVDVNGRNTDRAYTFTLRLSLVVDPTPPFATVAIADGRSRISTPETTVKVTASDALSGIDALRTRVDGGAWGDWVAPATRLAVTLSEREGLHSVGLQARNGAGLVTTAVDDTVILDLTAPTVTLLAPTAGSIVRAATPTIRVRFSEAADAAAWLRGGLVVESPDGAQLFGAATYDAVTRIGSFIPSSLVAGVDYVVRLGEARDVAGNYAVLEPWTITYVVPTRVRTFATTIAVPFGSAATFTFDTSGIEPGTPLTLERLEQLDGNTVIWEELQTFAALGNGRVQRIRVTPETSGTYIIRYSGAPGLAASRSADVRLNVVPVIRFGSGTVARRIVGVNKTTAFTFTVAPTTLTSATLVGSKCTAAFTNCRVALRLPATIDAAGKVRLTWRATKGFWSWQLRVGATTTTIAGASPVVRLTVR